MNTFLIAQHHGAFLTINSMAANNIDKVTVIIPGSQVEKYNKMYNDNQTNPEFIAFKDYDKKIAAYIKEKGLDYKVFVVDDFDIRNMFVSTLKVVSELGYNEIVACILSGAIVNKDYRDSVKVELNLKRFGMCYSRVYQTHNQLSMYSMLGLPRHDPAVDLNFFVVDMTKITSQDMASVDKMVITEATRKKQISILGREYNGKDDILIGTAISARQTISHNLNIQSGYIISLWNKAITNNTNLKSEEIYGYPLNIYSRYAAELDKYLPRSTYQKIKINGDEVAKWTDGLYECLDIIDL